MKLEYKDGLLFTSIKITHCDKSVLINNIVVDTGASYCIIEPSAIEELGLIFTKEDEIEPFTVLIAYLVMLKELLMQ